MLLKPVLIILYYFRSSWKYLDKTKFTALRDVTAVSSVGGRQLCFLCSLVPVHSLVPDVRWFLTSTGSCTFADFFTFTGPCTFTGSGMFTDSLRSLVPVRSLVPDVRWFLYVHWFQTFAGSYTFTGSRRSLVPIRSLVPDVHWFLHVHS